MAWGIGFVTRGTFQGFVPAGYHLNYLAGGSLGGISSGNTFFTGDQYYPGIIVGPASFRKRFSIRSSFLARNLGEPYQSPGIWAYATGSGIIRADIVPYYQHARALSAEELESVVSLEFTDLSFYTTPEPSTLSIAALTAFCIVPFRKTRPMIKRR
jgi:hypothetical protein